MKLKALHTVRISAKGGFRDVAPGAEFEMDKGPAEEIIGMGAATPVPATKARKPKRDTPSKTDEGEPDGDLLG